MRTLNYGNYGIFLMMGNAGFVSSTVGRVVHGSALAVAAIAAAMLRTMVIKLSMVMVDGGDR